MNVGKVLKSLRVQLTIKSAITNGICTEDQIGDLVESFEKTVHDPTREEMISRYIGKFSSFSDVERAALLSNPKIASMAHESWAAEVGLPAPSNATEPHTTIYRLGDKEGLLP